MGSSSRAISTDHSETRSLRLGRGESRQLVGPDSTESGLTINMVRVKAGSAPGPYHYHEGAATFYLVLDGNVRFVVDGDVIDAEPHEGCFMSPGVPHSTHNLGDRDATILLVFDRSTEGDFVETPLDDPTVYDNPWNGG